MRDLPSKDIDSRSHGSLEEFLRGRLANATGATDEDGDEVLDAVALRIASANGFARDHLQRLVVEEQRSHCIDGRTDDATQSGAESGRVRSRREARTPQWAWRR